MKTVGLVFEEAEAPEAETVTETNRDGVEAEAPAKAPKRKPRGAEGEE